MTTIEEIKQRREHITHVNGEVHWAWEDTQIDGSIEPGLYDGLYAMKADGSCGIAVITSQCNHRANPQPTPVEIEAPDAAFIAHAPADIDFLLAELARVQAECAALKAENQRWRWRSYPNNPELPG